MNSNKRDCGGPPGDKKRQDQAGQDHGACAPASAKASAFAKPTADKSARQARKTRRGRGFLPQRREERRGRKTGRAGSWGIWISASCRAEGLAKAGRFSLSEGGEAAHPPPWGVLPVTPVTHRINIGFFNFCTRNMPADIGRNRCFWIRIFKILSNFSHHTFRLPVTYP